MAQPMWRRLWRVALGALLLVSVACSPAPRPVAPTQVLVTPTPVSRSSTGVTVVEAAEQYFNPAQLTVPVGATVRYVCTLHVGAGMWAEVIVQ